MADDLLKFPEGGPLVPVQGVQVQSSDLGIDLALDSETYNVATGINRGWGPRPGMAPLPGHQDTEAVVAPACNGLMASEANAGGVGLIKREKILAILPVTLGTYDDLATKRQHYLAIFTANGYIDAAFLSTYVNPVYKQAADLTAGLAAASWREEATLARRYKTEFLSLPRTATTADMLKYFQLVTGRYWASTCLMTVSGKDVPMKYLVAKTTSVPDATHAPNLNLWQNASYDAANIGNVFLGAPSPFALGKFKAGEKRNITVYCHDNGGAGLSMYYVGTIDAGTAYAAVMNYGTGDHVSLSGAGLTKFGAGVAYASVVGAVLADSAMTTNSSYKAALIAAKKPLAMIVQEQNRQANGIMAQWVDLTDPGPQPRKSVFQFQNPLTLANEGTSFACAPTAPSYFVQRGANTGILRQNITYEFAFSYYNKRLDYETNVGQPFSKKITATDYESLNISGSRGWLSNARLGNGMPTPWEWGDGLLNATSDPRNEGRSLSINDYEIRFYYRPVGFAEWLPAGFYDAAFLWFLSGDTVALCATAIPGTPGGTPGGFIDYSPLPDQPYDCVLQYKNRAFWFSESGIYYSLRNNVFAYPGRNSISAATGKYRGGVVHTQQGETYQTSRLVIFATDQTYVARFTGIRTTVPVTISADTTVELELDGSDLDVDFLTDGTAYSFRAAVVAEGNLYWWGQQGVYRDDGIDRPANISRGQEPDIFDLVDPAYIDQVHASYNSRTKEITWFYRPKTADSYYTHGLVYNVTTGEFFFTKFAGMIDATQTLKIESDDTPSSIAGERTLVFARETSAGTTQRAYFMDHRCRSGDLRPNYDFMVKQVSTPSAGRRRLTLATGYSGNAGAITIGDYICLQQVLKYAPGYNGEDLIGKVAATGAGYVDITLPTGATLDDAAFAHAQYLPFYHRAAAGAGLNGIPWTWKTRYWAPGGVDFHGIWLRLWWLAKLNLLKSVDPQTFDVAYRTPVCDDFITDQVELADNFDGNWQVYHALRMGDGNNMGQAIRFKFSGYHIGSEWVVQYLSARAYEEQGDVLKQFEG